MICTTTLILSICKRINDQNILKLVSVQNDINRLLKIST